jgi:hypothetical protein
MSTMGTSVAQSVAGATQAEHKAARDIERSKPPVRKSKAERLRRGEDEVELNQPQAVEAVRNLKDNQDQETADDRERQNHYRSESGGSEAKRPRLDIQG